MEYNKIRDWYKKNNYQFCERDYELNLIGIRNDYKATDAWDDTLVVCYKTPVERKVLVYNNFTTDPGYYFLKKKLLNPKGCAFVKEGFYKKLFTVGKHRGKYDALKQYKPVTVFRDSNKDNILDKVSAESGYFGINLHHGYNSKIIFNNSAGCQVLKNIVDLNTILTTANIHESLYGKGINYLLTNRGSFSI